MGSPWVVSDNPTPPAAAGGWEVSDSPTPSSAAAPKTFVSGMGEGGNDLSGGLSNLPHMIAHPIDAAKGIFEQQKGLAGRAVQDAKTGHYGNALWHGIDAALPGVGPLDAQLTDEYQSGEPGAKQAAMGRMLVNALPLAVTEGAKFAGPAAESTARGIINKGVVGARKGDFARDANMGRGYLANKVGPNVSMQGIADSSGEALDKVGQQIGDSIDEHAEAGKLIPADTIRKAIHPIIDKARQDTTAPGVVADPGVYDQLKASFNPLLDKADAEGGVSPRDLWNVRHVMNKSLNWGDQTRANLTKVQQQVSGALGGAIEDAVPGLDDLNENYKDLVKLHSRASERAATGSQSLTGMAGKAASTGVGALAGSHSPVGSVAGAAGAAVMDSIPVKTAVATGLHAVAPIAPKAAMATLPATLAAESGNASVGQESKPDAQKSQDEVPQAAPPKEQSSSEPTPDSHVFSLGSWIKSNPDGDIDEAKEHAEALGYEVTP